MTIQNDTQLMKLSHLDTMLARATRIDEIVEFRAKAEAMRTYAVNIKMSREQCQEFAVARIRSEHKAGTVLPTLNFQGNNQHGRMSGNSMSLKDYDITPDESYRWRTISQLPHDLFERLMEERFKSKHDITTDFFYKAGRIHIARNAGTYTDRSYTSQTFAIDSNDMTKAAQTIRDNLSAEQITKLIDELRSDRT